jgi:Flp pilus assembly protein CpaB
MGRLGGGTLARRRTSLLGEGRRGTWRRQVARRCLSAVLAGAAVLGSVAVARAPEGGAQARVLVAVRDLPTGHQLVAADVVEQARPIGFAPARALTRTGSVTGRRLAGPVSAGEVLTAGRLLGAGLLASRPDGEVAMHVAVADPGAAGLVRPGDRVDLLSADGAAVVRDVTVLAVPLGAEDSPSSRALGPGSGAGLVVAVASEEAGRIASAPPDAVGVAALTVVLRGDGSLR